VTAAYAWIRLSWAAALRPCRDPVVSSGDIDPEGAWLFVQDKDSPRFREARVVPLPAKEGAFLGRILYDGDQLRLRLRATTRIRLNAQSEKAAFFIIVDRRAVPLTPELVRRVLADEGLAELFPWPLNAPRHYWLTRALEEGIPLEKLEPFLGHLREPTPWGQLSLVSLQQLGNTMRQFATTILREVGFHAA
jgi:hypothetical protein